MRLYRLKFIRRYYNIKSDDIGYILNVPSSKTSLVVAKESKKMFDSGNHFIISYCGGIIQGRGIEFFYFRFGIMVLI